jgi:hypothetical protein
MNRGAVQVFLPLKLVSEANARDGWRAKAKRAHEQRRVTHMATRAQILVRTGGDASQFGRCPLTVTITRLGRRELDSDNLARACKAVRDGVSDALGVTDNDPRITWRPEQLKGRAYGVEIRIEQTPR